MDDRSNPGCTHSAFGHGLGRAWPNAEYRDRAGPVPRASGRVGYGDKEEMDRPDEALGPGPRMF
jgi:hypothetical protein